MKKLFLLSLFCVLTSLLAAQIPCNVNVDRKGNVTLKEQPWLTLKETRVGASSMFDVYDANGKVFGRFTFMYYALKVHLKAEFPETKKMFLTDFPENMTIERLLESFDKNKVIADKKLNTEALDKYCKENKITLSELPLSKIQAVKGQAAN